MAPSLLFLMICSNLLFLLSVETRGSSRWFIHYLLTYLLTAVSIAITVLQATKKKYRHTSHSRAPPYLNPNRDTHACRRQTSQTRRNMKLPVHRVVWVAFGLSSTSTPKFGCLLQQFRMGMATVVTCKVPSGIDFQFRFSSVSFCVCVCVFRRHFWEPLSTSGCLLLCARLLYPDLLHLCVSAPRDISEARD